MLWLHEWHYWKQNCNVYNWHISAQIVLNSPQTVRATKSFHLVTVVREDMKNHSRLSPDWMCRSILSVQDLIRDIWSHAKFLISRGQGKAVTTSHVTAKSWLDPKPENTAFSVVCQQLNVSTKILCPACENTTAKAWRMNINYVRSIGRADWPSFTPLKAWLMNIYKTNWRYRTAYKNVTAAYLIVISETFAIV